MKKFYVLMLAMLACVTANAARVFFDNTAAWTQPHYYTWTDGSDPQAAWPGTELTAEVTYMDKTNGSNHTYYYCDIDDSLYNKVIFNGDQGQTKDLPVIDNVVYSTANNNVDGTMDPLGNIVNGYFVPAGATEVTYSSIYFPVATYDHESAYLYTWTPQITSAWPGSALEKETVDGVEYWVFKVDDREFTEATFGGIQLNAGGDSYKFELEEITIKSGDIVDIHTGVVSDIETGYTPTSTTTYGIRGQIFGNENWGDYPMKEENGLWTYTGNAVPGYFGIMELVNSEQARWFMAASDTQINAVGSYLCAVEGDASTENFYNNLTGELTFTFDPATLTLVVSGEVEEIDYTQWSLKVLGGFNDWDGAPFTLKEDGTVIVTNVAIGTTPFKLVKYKGDEEIWLSTGGEVAVNETITLLHENENMTIAGASEDEEFDVFFDAASNQMKITKSVPTGIESVISDSDAAVEYFNLQGMRVDNPAAGMYIHRQGNHVTKVFVK